MSLAKTPDNRANELIRAAANQESAEILKRLNTTATGIAQDEAAERLEVFGPNQVAQEKQHSWVWRLCVAARNPLVILLLILAALSFMTAESTSDEIGGWLMLLMVVLGVSLRFIQESKANNAAAKLKA
jgi:Mg2+-importing ATPase